MGAHGLQRRAEGWSWAGLGLRLRVDCLEAGTSRTGTMNRRQGASDGSWAGLGLRLRLRVGVGVGVGGGGGVAEPLRFRTMQVRWRMNRGLWVGLGWES